MMLMNDDSKPVPLMLSSLDTPTLTKAELADLLFERLGLNKRESKDMVEAFFDIIHDALITGRDVKMSGFGNFNIRRKAPRPGRNPRTGEEIPIVGALLERLPGDVVGHEHQPRAQGPHPVEF